MSQYSIDSQVNWATVHDLQAGLVSETGFCASLCVLLWLVLKGGFSLEEATIHNDIKSLQCRSAVSMCMSLSYVRSTHREVGNHDNNTNQKDNTLIDVVTAQPIHSP